MNDVLFAISLVALVATIAWAIRPETDNEQHPID